MFTVPPGAKLIGCDLSGIEARVLAHYCMGYKGGAALADAILEGDFHKANAKLWGVDRDTAKGILYALNYGAGPAKLEAIASNGTNGKKLKDLFYSKYPAIKLLIDDLKKSYKINGTFIRTLDGRRIYIRSEHKLLNSLIQSASAVVFKTWQLKIESYLSGLSGVMQVLSMHDEVQIECNRDKVEALVLGDHICNLAVDTGRELGLKIVIEAEAKIGETYKDTH